MNRIFVKIGAGLTIMAAGCSSQGLSSRETGMQTYSEVVHPTQLQLNPNPAPGAGDPLHSMEIPAAAGVTGGPVRLDLPARVSVVQLGEIAPPESMLSALRARPELCARVSTQTGIFSSTDDQPRDRLGEMRAMARNLGSQYLLVFGGNIDSGRQTTGLAVFDLTIVGAFVVPSEGVAVSGKAAGSLIDVDTGRVLMNFSADTKGHGLAPAAFAQNAETAAIDQAKEMLVKNLTTDVLNQLGDQSKPKVALAAAAN